MRVERVEGSHRIAGDPAVDEWWEGELEERIRRIDAGETERIRSSEVVRALDERLGK